jgi:prefoldin subunit 5
MAQRTITITIGNKTKCVNVLNRVEPDVFASVREKLEDFGQVELGIWAIQFSTEKLVSLSNEAYLLGKKLYAERMVSLGNLAAAIKSFKEAEWYLDTVEEKPDFYDDILVSRRQCTDELKQAYEDHSFETERAIKLRDWNTAATELRTILELIPDREDPRHKDARKKLIEVDARLGAKR